MGSGETDPTNADTDGDSLLDGDEDLDGDGVLDSNETDALDFDTDNDGSHDGIDCNPLDSDIYPGAPEICGDGIDQDCDGGDLNCASNDGYGELIYDGVTILPTNLTELSPSIHSVVLDCIEPFSPELLLPDGQVVYSAGLDGGTNIVSEALAMDVLTRYSGAILTATENEVVYNTVGSIFDFLVQIDNIPLGVSVTRAVKFPYDDPYTVNDAEALLNNKLVSIIESLNNIDSQYGISKGVLVIMAYSQSHSDLLQITFSNMEASILGNTIVLIVTTNGDDSAIY
nr:putative metal-binding motif-containing protein [uncultured Carboxylicivirga sp.]